ncbi:GGDEF domain-containing protein [Marinococcus luteus]|uniref:GGDEF domain-containing protein n=1 Tax=Marinococcus luteus TaxID=1122204 RepID=UPI002ACC5334|nr:GGDEF domain-containing protein [Marinococcus luteus]MDZ5783481.1 GGDEF domain-containing protein [Marinococcus luteus]
MKINYLFVMFFLYMFLSIFIGIGFAVLMPVVIPIPGSFLQMFYIASIAAGVALGLLNYFLFFGFVRRCIFHFQTVLTSVRNGDLSARASFQSTGMIGRLNADLNRTIAHLEITKEMAGRDDLTKLPNRAALQQFFQEISEARLPYLLYFIDVDQFKTINDTYGHVTGDRVLQFTAGRIASACFSEQRLYRLGGDEFVIMEITGTKNGKSTQLTQSRIDQQLRVPYTDGENTFTITVSVGTYESLNQQEDFAAVLHKADQAMYKNKRQKHKNILPLSE